MNKEKILWTDKASGRNELSRNDLKLWLEKVGVNLEISEQGMGALRKKKYTEKYPNRRPGLVEVWGEEAVTDYERWADEVSVGECARFTFKSKSIDRSESRGLKQLLVDITQLVVDDSGEGMSIDRFNKRTYLRMEKGLVYKLMKEIKKNHGIRSKEYKDALVGYRLLKKEAKNAIGVVAMVSPEAVDVLWKSLQQGELPKIEFE